MNPFRDLTYCSNRRSRTLQERQVSGTSELLRYTYTHCCPRGLAKRTDKLYQYMCSSSTHALSALHNNIGQSGKDN